MRAMEMSQMYAWISGSGSRCDDLAALAPLRPQRTPHAPYVLDPQKPFHGGGQLRHLVLGPPSFRDGLVHAVLDVVLEQDERDFLRGRDDARYLSKDLHAVGLLLDHALEPPNLPLYPPQAVLDLRLVAGFDVSAQLSCTSR